MLQDSSLLIFVHIPRAGGTSMWRVLRKVYGHKVRRISGGGLQQTYADVRAIVEEQPHAYSVVGGHVPFGIGQYAGRSVSYLTVLRDPTDVMLSRYFKRQRPEVQARRAARRSQGISAAPEPAQDISPVDMVAQMQANPLTKLLSNAQADGLRNKVKITRAHLDDAKENLEHYFPAFALVERYTDSLEVMARRLGWNRVPKIEARNTGSRCPQTYSQDIYEVGQDVHALDYELYDFANALLERRQSDTNISD